MGQIMTEAPLVSSWTFQEDRNLKLCCDKMRYSRDALKPLMCPVTLSWIFLMLTSAHANALVYLWGTSYSDAFSKPGDIQWLLGKIKSKEDLCPQKGALETTTERSIKSLVDWFFHLLKSWPLYLLASRKLDQQNFLPWISVPGI